MSDVGWIAAPLSVIKSIAVNFTGTARRKTHPRLLSLLTFIRCDARARSSAARHNETRA